MAGFPMNAEQIVRPGAGDPAVPDARPGALDPEFRKKFFAEIRKGRADFHRKARRERVTRVAMIAAQAVSLAAIVVLFRKVSRV